MSNKLFCFALCTMLFALCFPAQAQQVQKVYRIGYLAGYRQESREEAFRQGLRELGYVEGQNIVIEWRFARRKSGRRREVVTELVSIGLDLIVTRGTGVTRAVQKTTSTVPIVMVNVGDAVGRGLVASLAQPGGNVTGLTTRNQQLAGKRLQVLKEAFPQVSRIAVLWNPSRRFNDRHFRETQAAASSFGVQLQSLEVEGPSDLESAFRAALEKRADALMTTGSGLGLLRERIADLILNYRLPSMHSDSRIVRVGGLMSYTADRIEQFKQAATYVDKILKGAKPADLPVQQPTKFELMINLKTAKQIGVTIPPELLLRADKVIK